MTWCFPILQRSTLASPKPLRTTENVKSVSGHNEHDSMIEASQSSCLNLMHLNDSKSECLIRGQEILILRCLLICKGQGDSDNLTEM